MATANHRYRQFNYWIADEGETREEPRGTVEALYTEHAAEVAAEMYHSDGGYSGSVAIHIEDDAGEVTEWDVRAEPTVSFYADRTHP